MPHVFQIKVKPKPLRKKFAVCYMRQIERTTCIGYYTIRVHESN